MNRLVSHKLDVEGRLRAEFLVEEIEENPIGAAFEIVGLRQLGNKLAAFAINLGHSESCQRANDEMRDALDELPSYERQPGDFDYRCACGLSALLDSAREARLL